MAYENRIPWHGQTADALTSAADHGDIFAAPMRIKVWEVGAIITTATDGVSTVKADKVNDATRGDGDAGVLTIPTATAVNKMIKDTTSSIFPFVMNRGETIIFEVTSAAATAGGALYYVIYEIVEETTANDTDVTESA